jgi:hypothetical protein
VSLGVFALGATASAAEFRCTPNVTDTSLGQVVRVTVSVDAGEDKINAVGGEFSVPTAFEVIDVTEEAALGGLWVERPSLASLKFSKMVPGGFVGPHHGLFSVFLKAKSIGTAAFNILSPQAFLHDGQGTPAAATVIGCTVTVTESGYLTVLPPVQNDTDPPEPFTPIVSRDTNLLDGKFALVFSASDVGSSVDRYEVAEIARDADGKLGEPVWVRAASPYQLHDQTLASEIRVRAIDRFGNTREAIVAPAHPKPWYEGNLFRGILCVIITLLIGFIWRIFAKRSAVRRG